MNMVIRALDCRHHRIKNEVAVIKYQRTKFKKPGHSQMWIAKTEQVNMSEVNCCKKNCIHVTSIV
jgi:hypothetical protein